MDINRFPILYLGKGKNSGAYFFYANREGTGRFLKYLTYPMWCAAGQVDDFLDITAILPQEMMDELQLFVHGKVTYEPYKKRVNSKQVSYERKTVDQSKTTPEPPLAGSQREGTERKTSSSDVGSVSKRTLGKRSGLQYSELAGNSNGRSEGSRTVRDTDKSSPSDIKRRRSTRKSELLVESRVDDPKGNPNQGPVKAPVESEVVKAKRGRPRGSKNK